MPRILLSLLTVAAVLYLGACVLLYAFQESLIYFPQPRAVGTSETVLKLPVVDADVLVSVRPHGGPKALLYFGGNAEDVSRSLPEFAQAFPDHALYLLHYRSYGGSTGKPSEEAIQRDATVLFDMAHAEHPQTVVIGRSLGSGVAVRLASRRPASRLILVTPYDSFQEIAASHFPHMPVRWILRDKLESWRYAPRITVPTLLLAAEHDEIIPRASTERLYTRFARGVASLRIIPGTGHNTISASPEYLDAIRGAL
ncbi:MAG TPA: alpha/beta hydrolase [Thermoanaerobaculia bacterium]